MKVGRGVCPGCKARYTSYFTNAENRRQQNKISKLYTAILMTRNKILLDQHYKKIDSIRADLERDMNQLRIEVEGPLKSLETVCRRPLLPQHFGKFPKPE